MIRLIITDDHKLIRDGLKAILAESAAEFQIVGEAVSGKQLISMLDSHEADVVLMDIIMPEMDGLEATRYLTRHFPHIRVLVLSMKEDEKYALKALDAGASGYILKTTDREELVRAIQCVVRGEQYISAQIPLKLLNATLSRHPGTPFAEGADATDPELPDNISRREMDILRLIAQGYTNLQISELLFTSRRTVEFHRQSLLAKTSSRNTASLIMYALKHHLIRVNENFDQ
jgi:DNA-binding NarL/FixJ family response regulator